MKRFFKLVWTYLTQYQDINEWAVKSFGPGLGYLAKKMTWQERTSFWLNEEVKMKQ